MIPDYDLNKKPTLVLLAAGKGSRFGGYKQIEPFGPNGETLLEYSVFDAIKAGFGAVLFVINGELEPYFQGSFLSKFPPIIKVDYVIQTVQELPAGSNLPDKTLQRKKPWGTGQAVWITRNKVKTPFVVINGDDFYGREALQTMADYLVTISGNLDTPAFCMLGYKLKNTLSENGAVSRGICQVSTDNYLQVVEERTQIREDAEGIFFQDPFNAQKIELHPEQVVSMNIFGFSLIVYELIETFLVNFLREKGNDITAEFYLPGVINQLIQEDKIKVKVLPINSSWFGVTYPDDKPKVVQNIKDMVEAGLYPSPLWAH